jgi:hypothetical protein
LFTGFACPKTAARLPQNAAFSAAKINENRRALPQNPASITAVSNLLIGPDFFVKVAVSRYGRFESFTGPIRGFPCPGIFGEAIAKAKSIYLRHYETGEPGKSPSTGFWEFCRPAPGFLHDLQKGMK